MNPCTQNKPLIVLFASNALDDEHTQRLRTHIETCRECRQYWQSISNLTADLVTSSGEGEALTAETNETFHKRLVRRIREDQRHREAVGVSSPIYRWWFDWRVKFPAVVVLGVLVIGIALRKYPTPPASPRSAVHPSGSASLPINLSSSTKLSDYRNDAHRSTEPLGDRFNKH